MQYTKTHTKKIVMQIDREYKITSTELKKGLALEGEIQDMGLYSGRSPNDIEKGVSPDKDIWYIHTKEIKKVKEGGQ